MKRNKDIPEREKARSHGYCCPYRQWGYASFDGGTYKDITTAISFPNNILCVQCSDAINNNVTSGTVETLAWSKDGSSKSKIRFLANKSSSGYTTLGAFAWVAIGW